MMHFSTLEHSHNNVIKTGIGTHYQTDNTHDHDEGVADDQPHLFRALVFVPVHADLDPGRESKTQGGQAKGAKQGNEQLQIGDGHGEED